MKRRCYILVYGSTLSPFLFSLLSLSLSFSLHTLSILSHSLSLPLLYLPLLSLSLPSLFSPSHLSAASCPIARPCIFQPREGWESGSIRSFAVSTRRAAPSDRGKRNRLPSISSVFSAFSVSSKAVTASACAVLSPRLPPLPLLLLPPLLLLLLPPLLLLLLLPLLLLLLLPLLLLLQLLLLILLPLLLPLPLARRPNTLQIAQPCDPMPQSPAHPTVHCRDMACCTRV